jgi:hypothetical protein
MDCDLQLRHAARATSAAPSYFKPMTIQGRQFVDGGYGETNNPSWAAWLHYKQNHNLPSDRTLVMINIGTGTCSKTDVEPQMQQRPIWTKLVPNGIVSALGLMADLTKMATESEGPTSRLWYIADTSPEQLFIERFSADTGIDTIKLDDWQAATRTDRPSIVETKTKAYLEKPEVRERLKRAASALSDVYVGRQAASTSEGVDTGIAATVQLSSFLEVSGAAASIENRTTEQDTSSRPESSIRTPSLLPPSEPTQSPGCSPPRTPEPSRSGRNFHIPTISTEHTNSLLQGQGEQFNNTKKGDHPSSPPPSPASPSRSGSRKARRSLTYPLPVRSSMEQ